MTAAEQLAGQARAAILAQPPHIRAQYASHLTGPVPPRRARLILAQLRRRQETG
jgi:hypothetical protein